MRLVTGDALYPFLPQIADMIREHLPEVRGIENHQAIAIVSGQDVLAVLLYGNYSPEDVWMHVASISPRWCTRAVLRGIFGYPFNQLRVRRVTALVAKSNKHCRQFIERLGFSHEGTHPESLPNGGATCSYGMTRKHCKWIS